MWLTFFLLAIFFGAVASTVNEGMWSNAVRLINVVTAALLALSFFEPLARYLEDLLPSFTYYCDFLALWAVFVVASIVLRLATDKASRVSVRFLKIADHAGSVFFAVWIGWVMVCFTMVTLHAAPLSRNPFRGAFQPEKRMVLGLAPDRQMLGFMQKVSMGVFSRSEGEEHMFDPTGQYMPTYATRRAKLESHATSTGATRVN